MDRRSLSLRVSSLGDLVRVGEKRPRAVDGTRAVYDRPGISCLVQRAKWSIVKISMRIETVEKDGGIVFFSSSLLCIFLGVFLA